MGAGSAGRMPVSGSAARFGYDNLGRAYARQRRGDPAVAAQLRRAIGAARTVVNVGAGPGSYEPPDLEVVAVEPSTVMLAQRPAGAGAAVRAVAEALPFGNRAFDAAMAVLTMHHWVDPARGLTELCRVARRTVVLTFDVTRHSDFWLVAEYLPEVTQLDRSPLLRPEHVAEVIGATRIETVLIRHDCRDGFLGAYWRRPGAYLDPAVRAAISGIARLPEAVVTRGMSRLAADLASGRWAERQVDLLERQEIDLGYRLIVREAR